MSSRGSIYEREQFKSQLSAFGEQVVVTPLSSVELDAVHGITDDIETFAATGGSVDANDRKIRCQSGTSLGGYGTARSKRQVSYRPGSAIRALWTARFTTGIALSYQFAGMFTAENAVGVGYDGATFGFIRQTAGKLEIRRITVDTGATGAETLTLTLNGTAYSVSLTAGTPTHNAEEIAAAPSITGQTAFKVFQNGATLVCVAQATGVRSGTYSFSSTGDATGSFAQLQAGEANARTTVAQADWNGPGLGFTPDWTKLNVFKLDFPWLGAGPLSLWIMHPDGSWRLAHRLEYPNAYTIPSATGPSMNIGWVAASLGSTGTNLTVEGSSANLQVMHAQGSERRNSRGLTADLGSITTTFLPVLSIRVRPEMNGVVSHREILIHDIIAAFEHTKTGAVRVLLNPTLTGASWTYVDQTNSCIEYDTAATAVTGGTLLAGTALGKSDSQNLGLPVTNRYEREDIITVAVRASSGTGAEASVALDWIEV